MSGLKVGSVYPLSVRIGGFDYESDRMPLPTYDEPIKMPKILKKPGLMFFMFPAAAAYLENSTLDSEMFTPLATNAWAAEAVKRMSASRLLLAVP